MSEQEPRGQEKGRDYWLRYVDDRAVSLDEALKKCLKSGSKISTGFAGGLPLALYRRIGSFALENDLCDLQIASAMLTEPFDFLYGGIKMSDSLVTKYKKFKAAAETRKRVRYVSGFMSPVTATKIPLLRGKSLYEAGLTALYPYHFYNIINFHWAPDGDPWCDVGVGLVSPPDENGFCSFGPASDTLHAIVKRALETGRSKLIALVNPNVPRTYGTPEDDNAVRVDNPNITCIVKDDTELAHLPVDPRKRTDRMKTAENAAQLIPDGATLQIGIGDISSRVCMALLERGWHGREYSEMLPDALFKLFEEGRIAGTHIQRGSEREYVEGKLCCTFAMAVEGSDMYKKLDYNKDVIFMPAHKQVVAEGFTDCWGVNNGLSIDLSGQASIPAPAGCRRSSGV